MKGVDNLSKTLTISELAEKANIAESTVRRYLHNFRIFFNNLGGTRGKRYDESAVKVLVRIKNLFDQGFDTEKAISILSHEFTVVLDGENDEDKQEITDVPTFATSEDVAEIKAALAEQKVFNQLLMEKLTEQDRYIKESMNKRDKLLLESLRAIQSEKLEIAETAASEEMEKVKTGTPEKKRPFFLRLFK